MSVFKYKVNPNESINLVESTGRVKTDYYREMKSFIIDDNNIFNPTYPVRIDFINESIIDNKKPIDEFNDIYLAFDTPKVEYSSFEHRPSNLETYTRFYIDMKEQKNVKFSVTVSGGIKIWVNRKEVFLYKPYVRNTGSIEEFEMPLDKGINEVQIFFNDLAERDVIYYYELKNISNEVLNIQVNCNEDMNKVFEAYKTLNNFYLDRDYFEEGPVFLNYSGNKEIDLDIEYRVFGKKDSFKFNKDFNNRILIFDIDTFKTKNIGYDYLLPIENHFGPGYVQLSTTIGRITLKSNLFISAYPKRCFEYLNNNISDSYEERRNIVLNLVAKEEKANSVAKAMAELEVNKKYSDNVYKKIEKLLDKINNRLDCADFELAALIWLYKRYSDLLPIDIREKVKDTILSFRYWADEPGNDCMCFYSENHQMGYHTAQYMAGILFENEIFKNSGRLGKEQKEFGKARLNKWLDGFLKRGFSEWYSATYIPVDIRAFVPLYEFAVDDDIKEKVTKGLDLVFKTIGYSLYGGMMIATQGRTYEKEIKADKTLEMSYICYLAYGSGYMNFNNGIATTLALGIYKPFNYYKEHLLKDNEYFKLNALQGYVPTNTYIYRTNYYQASSCIKYNVGLYGFGCQDCSCTYGIGQGENTIRIWISQPGEKTVSGEGRPSYWTGDGTRPHIEQYNNKIFGIYKMNENTECKKVHAYVPFEKLSEYKIEGNNIFIRKDESYLAIYFSNGVNISNNNKTKSFEVESLGDNIKMFSIISSKVESKSFEKFIELFKMANFKVDDLTFEVDYNKESYKMIYNDGLYKNNIKIEYENTSELKPIIGEL